MIKAVIFDMDGILVDSESLWKIAEREVFSSLGVIMDDESCTQTMSMTTAEVTKFWFAKNPWKGKSLNNVEQMVVSRVIELIQTKDCEIDGIKDTVRKLKSMGFKIGLATNAPYRIVPEVLTKLELAQLFNTTTSSEFEERGKPYPDVYITASKNLDELAHYCIAIEDSESGIKAAKRAGMTVIGFTNNGKNKNLSEAELLIDNFKNTDWDINIERLNEKVGSKL
ncbi:HAD family hydrolase [Marinoscillum sp.]|uniref:HAD family hydrolase n=1 Tax=Marinoscillum sp. TaxID=2024838 RepID=UPI003BAD68DB